MVTSMKLVVFSRWREIEPVVRSSIELPDVGVVSCSAGWAHAVRELRFRPARDVPFHPFPFACLVANVLAERADRQQAFENFYAALQRALEFREPREPQCEDDDNDAPQGCRQTERRHTAPRAVRHHEK